MFFKLPERLSCIVQRSEALSVLIFNAHLSEGLERTSELLQHTRFALVEEIVAGTATAGAKVLIHRPLHAADEKY